MNRVVKSSPSEGFTIIELLLAMSFLAVLLVAITLTILQVSGIYNRGITIKEVNQAGLSLSTEFTQTIQASAPFAINGSGSRYIVQGTWGGRLCLGTYSYIWNYGSTLTATNPTGINTYANSSDQIDLVKAYDAGGAYCSQPNKQVNKTGATELLSTGDHALALHQLTVTSSDSATDAATGQELYTVNYTIGTNDTDTLATNDAGYVTGCKPPGDAGADPVYCVVQQFSLVARAGGTQ